MFNSSQRSTILLIADTVAKCPRSSCIAVIEIAADQKDDAIQSSWVARKEGTISLPISLSKIINNHTACNGWRRNSSTDSSVQRTNAQF